MISRDKVQDQREETLRKDCENISEVAKSKDFNNGGGGPMLLEEYREELEKEVKIYRDKRSAKKKVLLQREEWHKEIRRNAGSTEKKSI
jgi:hypothetical protein